MRNINTIREICRLLLTTDKSISQIERITSTSFKRVRRIGRMLKKLGLSWGEIVEMSDSTLKKCLYPKHRYRSNKREMDFALVYRLMQNKHQTLIQIWEDYRIVNPSDAYSYSQFTCKYRDYLKSVDLTMRMVHRAGECLFLDYAGMTIPWTDRDGKKKHAQLFIGVSGASNYTFVIACKDQSTESWIHAHIKMFEFFEGVHEVLVPDNLKAAVIKAGRFPEINKTYLEMARHYGCIIEPARVRKPQDKAKAEAGVLFVSRWISAPLRRREFFNLEEINDAINELLPALNSRKFRRIPGSRLSRFLEIDKPALKPLPSRHFKYGIWIHEQKVGPDYHVYVENHAYSVPYECVGKLVEARHDREIVELFCDGKRVASHKRSFDKGGHTVDPSHMPKAHQKYAEQHRDDYHKWAKLIGPHTEKAILAQYLGKAEYSYAAANACARVKHLSSIHGTERLEAACERAEQLSSLTVKTIRSILQRKLDRLPAPEEIPQLELPLHENVRGSSYYVTQGGVQ